MVDGGMESDNKRGLISLSPCSLGSINKRPNPGQKYTLEDDPLVPEVLKMDYYNMDFSSKQAIDGIYRKEAYFFSRNKMYEVLKKILMDRAS